MLTLEGSVERIVYRNEENHYTVARFRLNDSGRLFRDDLTTIVGALPGVQVGELLSVEGEWEQDPLYGRQLHVSSFTQRLPASKEGIERYLSSGLIKGIGPSKAKRIVEHFGEQTLAIIEQQPERLSEVKGIGAKDRQQIITTWAEQSEIKELHLFLQSHEVSMNVATRIYKQYGKESIRVVRENPYQMAQEVHGIGFRTADDIAVKLGLPLDSIPRLASGLTYVLQQAANNDGHCFLLENELLALASDVLKAPVELLPAAIRQLSSAQDVFIEDPFPAQETVGSSPSGGSHLVGPPPPAVAGTSLRGPAAGLSSVPPAALRDQTRTARDEATRDETTMWDEDAQSATWSDVEPLEHVEPEEPQSHIYYAPFWHAENGSARLLRRLLSTKSSLPPTTDEQWEKVFALLKQKRNMHLVEKQRQAVQMAYNHKVCILTGGPGTGKSTSLRALLLMLRLRKNISFALAAPTGRAAKRLAEATSVEAKTLHRLLEYVPHDNSYQRNEHNPLPYDFVIVDEFSMVDILLFYHLLKALPRESHLLLVGDADQLPSVGPGNALRDLLRCEVIPTVRLTDLFRQAQQSKIIVNAHRINTGQMPNTRIEASSDFFFMAEEDPARVQQLVLDLVQRRLPARYHFNPLTDIQVLAPMYRGDVGVDLLNEQLQARLNPSASVQIEVPGKRGERRILRVGDKVMQLSNNYDKGVFNGDVGWIRSINKENSRLNVEFMEEAGPLLVEYHFHELSELTLAYAVTVHKSQGSEYPAVVIPLVKEHRMLLQRNLLYTAITRAKRFCVLVGQPYALELAVRNDRVALRNTGLAERLLAMSNGSLLSVAKGE